MAEKVVQVVTKLLPNMRKETSTNTENLKKLTNFCPMQASIQKIGGRWKSIILWYINQDINRFSDLLKSIDGVSKRMLSLQLKELEIDNLIERVVISEKPLHVEYGLTELGKSLLPIFEKLNEWGEQFRGE
jgi:DNA-binding HxlR family transcriptional regulator